MNSPQLISMMEEVLSNLLDIKLTPLATKEDFVSLKNEICCLKEENAALKVEIEALKTIHDKDESKLEDLDISAR
uniref:Uncharacterized protein n=1 Tax=Rhodnius prolixus TaxID=13249 RepID=T1HML1_RHOPR